MENKDEIAKLIENITSKEILQDEPFVDDNNLFVVEEMEDEKSKISRKREDETFIEDVERIYIIQPILNDNYKTLHDEAVALIESAGGLYAGTIYQKIKEINPSTYMGIGKMYELRERLDGLDVTVLFNGTLSPSQTLNISAILDNKKVIDRATLILDIFAKNAKSAEGKVQVELAQLKYIYPRLKGKGSALSRLGGGIGTRGPGETQLETDRRHIRTRIDYLEARLKELEVRRENLTKRREKNNVKTIALVGYTNTGKSTLMNRLCNADVLEKDALFATLDPTARTFEIEGVEYLLVDTVGFLQDLPTNLIEAFKSTLESAVHCDLALIVCDAQGDYQMQLNTTLDTLAGLNFSSPYLLVMNKSENLQDEYGYPKDSIFISAKEDIGIDVLKEKISEKFKERYTYCTLEIPYDKFSEYAKIKNLLIEREINYTDFGMEVKVVIPNIYVYKFEKYIKK